MAINKSKTPFIRDVYLAYLIKNARRTKVDEFPIIEKWMVTSIPPKQLIQRDRRSDIKDLSQTAVSFYCRDSEFQPILGNPKKYVNKLKMFGCVVGMDASPYENMPLVVQKSQIYLNLAITYYFGSLGLKIIPNVRLGDNRTLSSLEAYPHNTLIAIGTHGFTKLLSNRYTFSKQVKVVIDTLTPSGICVYGPALDEIFLYAKIKKIPIYQYDSYTMKQNARDKELKKAEKKYCEG